MCALVDFSGLVDVGVRDCLQHQEGEKADGVEIRLVSGGTFVILYPGMWG